jgi:hypothetical protein
MRFNKLGLTRQVSEKSRSIGVAKKKKLNYGDLGFTSKKKFRFELIYFVLIKKYLKKICNAKIKKPLNKKAV